MKMVLRVSNENGAAADVTVSAVDLVAFEEEFPDFKEWLATDPDVEALDDSETVPLESKP